LSMGHSSSVSEIVIFDTPVVASSLILVSFCFVLI
jgi:hypothetical protein